MTRSQMARYWMIFGVTALLLSGALSIIVTGSKMPFVKSLITNLDYIRWCLVIHVNLATLVWFTAIPVGLGHLMLSDQELSKTETSVSLAGLWTSILGVLMMMSALPSKTSLPVLSNYIPAVTHVRHDLGILFYFIGVLLNYLTPAFLIPKEHSSPTLAPRSLLASRFGHWGGTLYFIIACVALVFSFWLLKKENYVDPKSYYEIGMWGGGHLLQHSSSIFLIMAWVILVSDIAKDQTVWTRQNLFPVFSFMLIPAFVAPLLMLKEPITAEYREGFTAMMQWGLFPAMTFFILKTIYALKPQSFLKNLDSAKIGLLGSFALILLGFVFGSLIRGYDLRVPGHYHATIGAVTLAFMMVSHKMLFGETKKHIMKYAALFYSIGQILFASGMFTAGAYGVGRKTYGDEHVIDKTGQIVGFSMMGLGGLLALTGGILFGYVIITLFKESKSSQSPVAQNS